MHETWQVPGSVIEFVERHVNTPGAINGVNQRKIFRLLMLIHNGSAKAARVCMMFDRGEISGDQLLEMLDRSFTFGARGVG